MRTLRSRESGFTLIELLVALVVVSLVLGGAMAMFNYTNKLARAQLHQADLQQSARAGQRDILGTVRMAGRGGLPGHHVAGLTAASGPASITPALSVRNNVTTADQRLVSGNATSPLVVEGSDVLTVRGHFTSPLLFLDTKATGKFVVTGDGGLITLSSRSPGGIPQDMSAIVDAVDDERSDAIVLVSGLSGLIYGVAELDWAGSDVSSFDPDPFAIFEVTIAYKNRSGTYTDEYGLLSADGVFPDTNVNHPAWLPARDLTNLGAMALLEEYRYYVRDPEDGNEPRLSVGRFFPGTEVPHPSGGWETDLADSILDLQVALGFDSSHNGGAASNGFFDFDDNNTGNDDFIVDGDVTATAGTDLDDWLFNDDEDTTNLGSLPWTPTAASGSTPPAYSVSQPKPRLYYARLTTLTMAGKPDRGYQAPYLDSIEDHDYTGAADDPANGTVGRLRRRLILTTVVDLRNL